MLVLLAGCEGTLPAPPRPESIEPAAGARDADVPLTIRGRDFFLDVKVSYSAGGSSTVGSSFQAHIGGVPLREVAYRDFHTLTAVVPAGVPVGTYDLVVTDPAGRTGTLAGAFTVLPSATRAAWSAGTFVKSDSATDQIVPHGLGEPPRALLLWSGANGDDAFASGLSFGLGISDGSTSRALSKSSQDGAPVSNARRRISTSAFTLLYSVGVLRAEADLVGWSASDFTLRWTANDAAPIRVHFLAIGGTGVSARVVGWTMPTAPATVSIAGVGFRPEVVIHAHAGYGFTAAPPASGTEGIGGLGVMTAQSAQWALLAQSPNGRDPSDNGRAQRLDACVLAHDVIAGTAKLGHFASMDPDGFSVSFSVANNSPSQIVSLALAGVRAHAAAFDKSTGAAPALQTVGGLGFAPRALLLTGVHKTSGSLYEPHNRFALGASDGAHQTALANFDTDALATTHAGRVSRTGKIYAKVDNDAETVDAEAELAAFSAQDFTLRWISNDAVPTQIVYLVLGDP